MPLSKKAKLNLKGKEKELAETKEPEIMDKDLQRLLLFLGARLSGYGKNTTPGVL